MTSVSSQPIAKLSSPGAIVATVPSLCGFLPSESVVVLSLRGSRKRIGLTVRLDLPEPAQEVAVAAMLAERVVRDGGAAAVAVVYGADRREALVDTLREALTARAVDLPEVLHVREGRWTSYACSRSCCPPDGTPVPPAPVLVEAARALDGRAVLQSREELVRSLAPPVLVQARACLQELQRAERRWLEELDDQGVEAVREQVLSEARALLRDVTQGGQLELPQTARFAVALHDVLVRDEVATWSLKRADALLALLEQVARLTTAPYDAPVCTLLAWVSHARGDGARANVALDRALASDPAYSLALLLREALDAAIPPREVRALLRDTRRALRSRP